MTDPVREAMQWVSEFREREKRYPTDSEVWQAALASQPQPASGDVEGMARELRAVALSLSDPVDGPYGWASCSKPEEWLTLSRHVLHLIEQAVRGERMQMGNEEAALFVKFQDAALLYCDTARNHGPGTSGAAMANMMNYYDAFVALSPDTEAGGA